MQKTKSHLLKLRRAIVVSMLLLLLAPTPLAHAADPSDPQSGSIGLEGTISSTPPDKAATISTPANGSTVTTMPITVSGLCTTGLLIKVFSNNVFIGSTVCQKGSYSLQVNLFSGANDIVVRVYDALDQAGPDSNTVRVTFNDAQFIQFNSRVSISSDYARRGANPGDELDWPITLSGGTGPYALSVDWGDGTSPDLQSVATTGLVTLKHIYKTAGTYQVVIKATDKNGTTGFLQLVGVANGAIQSTNGTGTAASTGGGTTKTIVIWWPSLIVIPFLFAAFWLGRRHELYTIRKQLDDARNAPQ